MTPLERLEKHLNVTITNFDTLGMIDLQLTEYLTADGYGIYTIIERIVEVAENIPEAKIYIDDVDEHMDDYDIERWLSENIDDDGTE